MDRVLILYYVVTLWRMIFQWNLLVGFLVEYLKRYFAVNFVVFFFFFSQHKDISSKKEALSTLIPNPNCELIHSFSFSKRFILVWVMLDPEPILGKLGAK